MYAKMELCIYGGGGPFGGGPCVEKMTVVVGGKLTTAGREIL
eukprot:gene21964-16415_t